MRTNSTFSVMKRLAFAVLFVITGSLTAFAQNVTVSGTVTDEQDAPMIGVSVIEKGTQNGVMTDIDGKYEIKVKPGAVLQYSYIGYLNIEKNAINGVLNIRMEPDNEMLEETVVVGYGVQKKSSLTGAVSQVKSEDIENRTITTPESALQGKTAGVQIFSSSASPGASPTVRIRGISSNSSSDPLYVVDGRITNSISGIDPNDIESMEVLKDGASAAIYGARAGNGVVLITTRRGKGDGKISYNFQLTSQSISKVPQVLNSEEYMQWYLEDGRFNMETFYRNWDFKTNTDWIDYSYEPSMMQRHNITFSAGNEKGSIYVSGTYLNNDGMFAGDADVYERLTGMINATWNIKKWFDISTNNQIERYKVRRISEGSDYGSAIMGAIMLDPLTPTTYTDENLPDFMRDILNQGKSLLQDENGNYYGASAYSNSENVNPLIQRDRSYSTSSGFNINGSTSLNFKPFKFLTVTSRLGYRLSASDSYGYGHDYYINTNAFQNYINLNASSSNTLYYQWENFANYMQRFGKHNLSAMVGMSYSHNRSYSVSGSKSGSDDDLGVTQDNPLFYYFAYATTTANDSVSGGQESISRNLSYFGRISYDYANKYFLQASFRADAADLSVLPKPRRWGYFPSVSAGWTVSEESFFAGAKNVMNFFKIRGSWGQNGSTAGLGGYRYANVIESSGNYPTTNGIEYILGYSPSSTGNQELKWETSEQLNFGLDMRFFRDRLSFTADWFRKETKDLIVSGITPSTVVGVSASPVNAGNVLNTGFEFELKWKDQIGDFNYSVSGNVSTLRNEVTYIHESLSDGIDGTGVRNYGTITRFEKGMPAWHFYGYKYKGTDPANGSALFEDLDGDGSITQADKTDLGSGIPKANFGLTLTAGWKGIDAVVFLTGAVGSKIYNCLSVVDYPTNKLSYFYDDRWTPTNTDGTTPAASATNWQQYLTSDGVVFSGDYLKIKQIQLGYTFPKKWMNRIRVENFRIYASLDDFFTFSDYIGFDPEVTGVGSSLGVDKGSYPTSKKVVFGLNLTF